VRHPILIGLAAIASSAIVTGATAAGSREALTASRVAATFRGVGLPLVSLREPHRVILIRSRAAQDPLSLEVSVFARRGEAERSQKIDAAAHTPTRVVRPQIRAIVIRNAVVAFDPSAPGAERVRAAIRRLRR
jgi:hypothetical protein